MSPESIPLSSPEISEEDIAAVVAVLRTRHLSLLDDQTLAKRLGDNGKEYAKKNDWRVIARQFIEMYQRVIPSP